MSKNVGDFAREAAGVDERVPLLVNGLPVHNIFKARTAEGDLQMHLHVDLPPAPPAVASAPHTPTEGEGADLGRPPEAGEVGRRLNDPAELSEEEREALRQTERLAGVPERRANPDDVDASAPAAEQDAVAQDSGDQGSEIDPL